MLVAWKYKFRNSFIDTFDPRARWIVSFLVLAAVLNFWDLRFLSFFFALSLLQVKLTKLTWEETKRAWTFVIILVVFIVGINAFVFGRGGPALMGDLEPHVFWERVIPLPFGWSWTLNITAEKTAFAVTQIVRMLTVASLFFIIPWTMDPSLYGVTFGGMGLPYRFAFAMDLAFRFVPTLARDFQMTLDAQKARGFEIERLDGGIVATIRKVAPLLVPVVMNAIIAGEDIVNAMDLRCFGLKERTWIDKLTYQTRDYVLIGFGVVLLVVSLVLNHVFGLGDFWVPQWLIDMAG